MASTYSTNLKIELIGTGEQSGIWGATTNANLGTALEQAIVGKADVTMSSTTVTLSLTNTNAAQNARAFYLNLTGTPGGAATLEVPAVQKPYVVRNGTTGGNPVTVKVSGQTGVTVPSGATMWLYNNGTDVVNAITNLPSGSTVGGVPISTGSSSGTVESVALSGGTTGITVSGSPITTTGTFTLGGTVAATHGGTAQNTYSTGDLLYASATDTISRRTIGSTGQILTVSGGVPVWATPSAGVGTVTSVGGTGNVNGITLTGTVTSSGNLTLGGTLSNVGLSSQVTGTLPVANGGTGQTGTPTNGQLLIGTGSGFTRSTITAGSGITVTNGSGSITIASTAGGGTVTSVGGTGNVNGITLSGTVTSSGNLTLGGTLSNVSLSSQVTGTLPTSNGGTGSTSTTYCNLTSNVTGTLPVANGGTGATSLASAGIVTETGTQTISGSKTFSSKLTATGGVAVNTSPETGMIQSGGTFALGFTGANGLLFLGSSTTLNPGVEFTNGNVYKPGGGSFLATSDARNKTDVHNYLKGANDLNTLRPVSFKYSGAAGEQTGHKTYIGLIAQEVQETPFADMVAEGPDGYLGIDSSQLVYALVNAVKELKSELDLVKAELASLKN